MTLARCTAAHDDIVVAILRCKNLLGDMAGWKMYMYRGVRLLVQCVGNNLLCLGNPAVAKELDQLSRLSAELMDDDYHSLLQISL